ncbi:hypothetical protein, partial [Pseudomonas aeruginosa]
YKRLRSYFDNSEMAARGLPGADELALLEPLRGQIPEEVFGQAYAPPVNDGSGRPAVSSRLPSTACQPASPS